MSLTMFGDDGRQFLTAEDRVRQAWDSVIHNSSIGIGLLGPGVSFGTWEAALEFTEAHAQKIAEVDAAISLIKEASSDAQHYLLTGNFEVTRYILSMLQEARTTLLRGWRGGQ